MTIKTYTERHDDGKDYVNINDIQVDINVSNVSINFKYQDVASYIQSTINHMVSANWKLFKSIMDPSLKDFVSDLLKSTLSQIYDTVALQDFFQT